VDSLAGFNLVDELITRPPYMTHTIRYRLPASSGAVNEWQSQARFRARTKVCFSSMIPRKSNRSSYRLAAIGWSLVPPRAGMTMLAPVTTEHAL
jgi:hypothetical protein